jgi:hypothetical protein
MTSKTNYKRNVKNNQLTSVMDFSSDPKTMKEELKARVIFDSPIAGSVPNSAPPILFHRIMYGIKNPDGSTGDLILELDRCFSFGTTENRSQDQASLLNGYSTSIAMLDRDGASEKQLRSVQFVDILTEVTKEHLLQEEVKNACNSYDLEMGDLKKMQPLFRKKENGKIVDGAVPSMYPKLIWYKANIDRNGKDRPATMNTKYYLEDEVDENGDQQEVDPLDYIGVRHYITAAVKFESIFMGAKTKNIQIKMYEAEIKTIESGPKRLLRVTAGRSPAVIINGPNPLLARSKLEDEPKAQKTVPLAVDSSELLASDEEDDEEEKIAEEEKPKKKTVRKKVAGKAK